MNRCWGLAKINGGNYQHYLFAPPPSVTSWGPGPVIIIIATWADVKVKLSPQSKSSSHITLCTICDLWFCCIQCVYFRCSEQPFAWVNFLTRNHVLAAKTTSIFSYFIKTSCQENWFFFFFLWGGGGNLLCQWLLKLLQFNCVRWRTYKNTFLREKQTT